MATNKTSSTEDADLSEQIEAVAEEVQDSVSESISETESSVDDLADDAVDAVEDVAQDVDDALSDDGAVDENSSEASSEEYFEEPQEEAHVEPEEHYEEERRSSFAGRVLWLLALLVAGGALALWGGPKLAPMLPAPLAPLAKYLTPGATQVTTELAQLRAEMDDRLSALPEPVAQESIDAAIAAATEQTTAALDEKTGALSTQIAELSDQVTASDSGDIEARLSSLETKLTGMDTEFAALRDALGALESTDSGASELSAEVAAKIATYAASLEGLKAELAAVSSQNGQIGQRIDEVEAATNRKIEEADARSKEVEAEAKTVEQSAELKAAVAGVEEKLTAGGGFMEELASVASLAGVDAPAELMELAEAGVAPSAALANSYGDAASSAIRQSIKADAEEGTVSGFSAFLRSQVVTRSLTPQDGDSTDAVLSRMEAALKDGDLSTVLSEAETLPEPAAAAMSDWLNKARSRAQALDGLEALKAAIAARS